jgi:DNA-binding MarR family transcriptional regulator
MTDVRFASNQGAPPANGNSLGELASMLGRISNQLDGAREGLQRAASATTSVPLLHEAGGNGGIQLDVRRARALRGLRRQLLGCDYFSGPAWDILLHLFDCHFRQLRNTIGKLTAGTKIPATTVIRWLDRLENDRLIMLRDDPLDARRRFVELSPSGVEVMNRYFAGATTHLIAA